MSVQTFIADGPDYRWLESRGNGWQFGEQGLIDAILERIGDGSKRCMEIGAGDGHSLPVTVSRLIDRGWACRLFEIAEWRQEQLRKLYGDRAEVFGAWDKPGACWITDGVVIIDVDGKDAVIMGELLTDAKPALVICEHYDKQAPTHPGDGYAKPTYPPDWLLGKIIDGGFAIQAPMECLQNVAGWLGYDRIGTTRVNSFFVRRDLVERLKDV